MGVGKQLRQAREARGLTVREVAELTKISSRQIDAIETERYEKLPGGIFGRGYVRALAATLKLDADACARAYRDETEAEDLTAPVTHGAAGDPTPRRSPVPASASWREQRSEFRIRLAPAEEVVRSPAAHPGVIAAVLLGVGAILLILWLGRDRGATPPVSSLPAAIGMTAAVVPAGGARARPVGTSGEAKASSTRDGTEIRVEAARPCWVALTVDGERVAFRMLGAGESVRATMRASARLHTGDAGALRLSVAGSEPRAVGPSGAVKTVEIAPTDARNPQLDR